MSNRKAQTLTSSSFPNAKISIFIYTCRFNIFRFWTIYLISINRDPHVNAESGGNRTSICFICAVKQCLVCGEENRPNTTFDKCNLWIHELSSDEDLAFYSIFLFVIYLHSFADNLLREISRGRIITFQVTNPTVNTDQCTEKEVLISYGCTGPLTSWPMPRYAKLSSDL